jgi:hypothetical protein
VDTRNAVPCQHMAAMVMSCYIPELTQNNIMLYWWQLDHWRLQFPLEIVAECNVSMETIRVEVLTPNGNYCYCPSWSAPNKAGQPKKNERRKSVLEKVAKQKQPKKRQLLTRFCQFCHKFNHSASNCWELEKNQHK